MTPFNFDHTTNIPSVSLFRPHTRRLPLEIFPYNKQSTCRSPFINIICFKIIKDIQRFVFCLVALCVILIESLVCSGVGGRMEQSALPDHL